MPNGQYMAQRLHKLHWVEAMRQACLMNSGLTRPRFFNISQSVCLTLPTGE